MTSFTCPCCNSRIPAPPKVEALADLGAGHLRKILLALIDAYPKGLTREQIIGHMYDIDADVPLTVEYVVSTQMGNIRKLLQPYGWTVPKNVAGGHAIAVYRLQTL
jgi:hypothetical protein